MLTSTTDYIGYIAKEHHLQSWTLCLSPRLCDAADAAFGWHGGGVCFELGFGGAPLHLAVRFQEQRVADSSMSCTREKCNPMMRFVATSLCKQRSRPALGFRQVARLPCDRTYVASLERAARAQLTTAQCAPGCKRLYVRGNPSLAWQSCCRA